MIRIGACAQIVYRQNTDLFLKGARKYLVQIQGVWVGVGWGDGGVIGRTVLML